MPVDYPILVDKVVISRSDSNVELTEVEKLLLDSQKGLLKGRKARKRLDKLRKDELDRITKLLQNDLDETETASSFASTRHGIETVPSLPPKNAEFLLVLLLNKEDQEAAIGCFAELYAKRVIRWGEGRARVWAWVQVVKSLASVLKRVALKVSGVVAAYEWLKHHIQ